MKKITILSIFPDMVADTLSYGVIKRAKEVIDIESLDLRDWGEGTVKRVDDVGVSTGPGMVFKPDVVARAIQDVKQEDLKSYVIHMSPRGVPLTSAMAKTLSQKDHIIVVASRYEGLDQRVIDSHIDLEVSIGDFVLSGGELASAVLVDAVLRMTGSVLRMDAVESDSFSDGLLEYSHYTKPVNYEGVEIPEYLRSGDHQKITDNRFIEQLYMTWLRRPDLYREYPICKIEASNNNMLTKIKKQNKLLQERLKKLEEAIREHKTCPKS